VIGIWADVILLCTRLRDYPLKNQSPIVVLSLNGPSDRQLRKIKHFLPFYYIEGGTTKFEDLIRAGYDTASNIVILGSEGSVDNVSIDSKPILIYRLSKHTKAHHIVNIRYPSNLGLLSNTNLDSELEDPLYASGKAFLSSSLDTLLCQSFFNRFIVSMVEQLTSGRVYLVSLQDKLSKFIGQTYLDLFKHLLQADVLPVGLYRTVDGHDYPLTNPLPHTMLVESDKVYVICSI